MSTDQLRDLAMQLPPEGRASLAKDLIESLDQGESVDEAEGAWIEEIEPRAEAYHEGKITAEDWEISLQRARERLREGRRS